MPGVLGRPAYAKAVEAALSTASILCDTGEWQVQNVRYDSTTGGVAFQQVFVDSTNTNTNHPTTLLIPDGRGNSIRVPADGLCVSFTHEHLGSMRVVAQTQPVHWPRGQKLDVSISFSTPNTLY